MISFRCCSGCCFLVFFSSFSLRDSRKWTITNVQQTFARALQFHVKLVFRQSSAIAVWNATWNNSNLFSLTIPNSSKCEQIAYIWKKEQRHKWMCGLMCVTHAHVWFCVYAGHFAWFTSPFVIMVNTKCNAYQIHAPAWIKLRNNYRWIKHNLCDLFGRKLSTFNWARSWFHAQVIYNSPTVPFIAHIL